ncbi:MAG: TonB-dependent receptor [Candidatus Symbiothrix sp.]|jgi:hypothetical protein|nr:TonB-dependent receptor [Candidatus Symbiothrix sp.]
MNLPERIFYILIISACSLNAFSQTEPVPVDSIIGQEVVVTKHLEKKMTGLSIGKIVLNPASMLKIPSLSGNTDLLKLLELTPGVQNSGDASANIYIRGGDPGQNLLLYNNVPLYTSGHLLGFFSLFNSDHISALELNKTGIHARYGGRLSSVINVGTKKALPEKVSLKGNVGLLSSQATLELPLGDKFGLYVSGRKTYMELLMQPLLDATVNHNAKKKVEGLDYDFYDTNVTLAGRLSEKDKLTVDAFFGKDNFNITEEDLLLNGVLHWKNTLFSAQWDRQIGENQLSQQVYSSKFNNRLLSAQAEMEMDMQSEIQDLGYKNKYLFQIRELPVEIGMQYAFHQIQPQTLRIMNTEQTGAPDQEAHDAGIYGGVNLPLTSELNADLGLRYNVFYQDKLFQSLEPRIVLNYRFKETNIFRLAYIRQNQYINMLTPTSVGLPLDFWVAASSQLPPQSGNEFSLGYFHTFPGDAFEFSAEIFYRTMRNVNEYIQTMTTGQTNPYFDNTLTGNGRAYGLEVILKKNYGKFTGWLSYTLGRSERTFDEINRGKTFPAKFDRRHDLSLVSSYSFNEKWDLSLVYLYATGNAYTLPSSWYFINNTPVKEYGKYNGARMPDYNRTDVSLSYWYKKDNGLTFSVYNLFRISNPVYIFMNVKQDETTGNLKVNVIHKKLYTIVPAVSWRFKF